MKLAANTTFLVCDDVRQEINGKLSFIGVYSNDIIVYKLPTFLPILTVVVLFEKLERTFKNLYVTIETPGSQPISIIAEAPPNTEVGKNANIVVRISPFKISEQGIVRMEFSTSQSAKKNKFTKFITVRETRSSR